MQVTLAEIARKFDDILSGSLARRGAAEWGWAVLNAFGVGELEVTPRSDTSHALQGALLMAGICIGDADIGPMKSIEEIRASYADWCKGPIEDDSEKMSE